MSGEREMYIRKLIEKQGMTIKDFSNKLNIPYSTILSMLNGSIGGTAVDTVAKICHCLGISIDELQRCGIGEELIINDFEKELIVKYRQNSEYNTAINKLLDIGS